MCQVGEAEGHLSKSEMQLLCASQCLMRPNHGALASLDCRGRRGVRGLPSLSVLVGYGVRLISTTGTVTRCLPPPPSRCPGSSCLCSPHGGGSWWNCKGSGLLCALCWAASLLLGPHNQGGLFLFVTVL